MVTLVLLVIVVAVLVGVMLVTRPSENNSLMLVEGAFPKVFDRMTNLLVLLDIAPFSPPEAYQLKERERRVTAGPQRGRLVRAPSAFHLTARSIATAKPLENVNAHTQQGLIRVRRQTQEFLALAGRPLISDLEIDRGCPPIKVQEMTSCRSTDNNHRGVETP